MKNRLALILSLSLALVIVICMATGFAGQIFTQTSFNVAAGSTITLTPNSGINTSASNFNFSVEDTRVATVNADKLTITTYNLSSGWRGGTQIIASYNYGGKAYQDIIYVSTSSYSYGSYYYPYNTCYPSVCSNPYATNGFYYNTPYVVARPSAEAVVPLGQGRSPDALANEIANHDSIYFDDQAIDYSIFTSDNMYNVTSEASTKDVSKCAIKLYPNHLSRMGRLKVDGLRLKATNAPAALVLTPEAETAGDYSIFSIEGVAPEQDYLYAVAVKANNANSKMKLEFAVNSFGTLSKSKIKLVKLVAGEYEDVDLENAKLYRTTYHDKNGDFYYSYRLTVPDIGSGVYAIKA